MDDISHHHHHHQKFTTNTSWEPYTIAMEGHHLPSFANNYENLLLPVENNKEATGDHQLRDQEEPEEELGAMKEMMFKIAAMQPVDIDPATIRRPRRRNVRISDDPQSVAARHRRERISEKIRVLQRLVPGGTKMDTASMLDEAIRYVKFLKRQIRFLQAQAQPQPQPEALPGPSSHSYLFDAAAANNDHVEYPVCFNRRLI